MSNQFYIGLVIGTLVGAAIVGFVSAFHGLQPELPSLHSQQMPTDSEPHEYAIPRQDRLANTGAKKHDTPDALVDVPTEQTSDRSYQPITCDESCSQDLLNKFLSGYTLTSKELNLLTYGSHHVAKILSNNSDLFDSFNASVFQSLESDAQFALLRVIYHLPASKSTSFVEQLHSGSDNDRVNAMKLLAMLSNGKGNFAQRIETTIQTETSPAVLIASIDALNSVSPAAISDTTLSTLSGMLLYNEDQAVKGKALESLTELQHYDSNVQQFIQEGLESSSTELNLSSLHSLSNLLNEDKDDENKIPAATKTRIIEIANNDELPPDLRMQALLLMNTHMQNR